MFLIYSLVAMAVHLYILVIIGQVALSWLIAFDIVNASNPAAQNLSRVFKKLTDPVYKPLEKFIPPIGGIDIKPIVVIVGLNILVSLLVPVYW